MKRNRNRFESEVHLGLLVIIFILLFLNLTSNYIIFHARSDKTESVTRSMNNAALSISRVIHDDKAWRLDESRTSDFKRRHKLNGLILIPSQPQDGKVETRKKWFAGIVSQLPPGQIPEIARKLLSSDFKSLTRGENDEYFYVYPIPSATGKRLLILSRSVPDLAYLDRSSDVIFYISIVSMLVIAGVYLLLYRYILSPFKRIRTQALDAGREVDTDGSDVEAVVEEYEKLVGELREKEEQLLALNKSIQKKADSLEQFNKYLLASMSSGIVTVNEDGKVLSMNRAAAGILQANPGNHVGGHYSKLFGSGCLITRATDLTLTESRNRSYREYEFEAPDGANLSLGVTVSVIHDNTDKPIGASVLLSDLTEVKTLRQELEKRNRLIALGEMAGGLAHQLRNSMGAILGYSSLVKKRLGKNGIEIDSVEALVEETRQAETLIDRFLDFTRPFTLDRRRVNINRLIGKVIEKFRVRPDCRQVEFVLGKECSGPRSVEIELDGLLFEQALTNIIENAVNSYGGAEGSIEVGLLPNPEFLTIQVRDHGCGIAPENQEKIFTPFFSTRPSGTGLGLPLAGKIVDLHGGRLSVDSEPGKGTSFAITLPLSPTSPSPLRARENAPMA